MTFRRHFASAHLACGALVASIAATPAPGQSGSDTTRRSMVTVVPDNNPSQSVRDRARAALALVRTLQATPDTIRMEVGQAYSGTYAVTALDSAGKPVPGFVPVYGSADPDIARLEGPGGLVGMSAGRTYLRVTGTVPGEARPAAGEVRLMAQIPIIVNEASSPIPRPTTDSVPRDLVLALLGGGQRNPILRIGSPADGFPSGVAAGWRALGSATMYSNQSTSVFAAPYMARMAVDTIEARLAAAGWTLPALDTPPDRGFFGAYATAGTTNVRCLGTNHFWYSASSRRPNESQVVMILTRATTSGVCSQAARTRQPAPHPVPVVLLRSPLDVGTQPTTNVGSATEWRSEAVVQGNTSVARLGPHFADQMQRLGWAPVDSVISEPLQSRTYRLTTQTGTWQGVLTVSGTAPGLPTSLALLIRRQP